MVKKTVLKVNLSCEKRRTKILKSISDLDGVDKIEIDAAKDTVTVTGDADPYAIIMKARKAAKGVEVVSIGPPPAKPEEKKPEEKKPDEKKPEPSIPYPCTCIYMPQSCVACRPMAVIHTTEYPYTTCSIM
ncbi:hypothetical protein QVD17_36968 [Tagetes erecta]|uniref:HMA domain-containing protein n=1 Tax=Tagetes erecta TaxID=13708 RepID=A0AAD8NJE8_TARER|nr:hypothetical protein QVD17_36968 [Tagetes erecta]